jgi:hypothetical protein
MEMLLKRVWAALGDVGEREIRDEYVKLWLQELKLKVKIVAYEYEAIAWPDGKKSKGLQLDGVLSDEMAQRHQKSELFTYVCQTDTKISHVSPNDTKFVF